MWRSVAFCMIACISPEPGEIHEVASPGHAALDPLQEVDPKLLFSSRGKGLPRCRKNPTHMPLGGRVNVHHAWCEHADSVSAHTLCAETLRVSTASAGD